MQFPASFYVQLFFSVLWALTYS